MLTIINRKKEFPLHHFFGIDIKNIPSSYYLPSADSSLNLIITLRKLGKKNIALTCDATEPIEENYDLIYQKAKDLERSLDFTTSSYTGLKSALVYSMKDWYQLIINNQLMALDDQYVFFKIWPEQIANDIENFVFELQMNRYMPVLVSPEVDISFNTVQTKLSRLQERGVTFQIDCLSLCGFNGKREKKNAVFLMENDAVGSISLPFKDLAQIIRNDKILVSRKVADLLDFQLF